MGSLQVLKLGCLLGLAVLPLLCGLLPAVLLSLRGAAGTGFFARWRGVLSCAAGGVFLSACLLDIVPDSLADLREDLSQQIPPLDFPVPELVLALGFLLVLVLEHIILACSERQGDEASLPLLPCPSPSHSEEGSLAEQQQQQRLEAGTPHCHMGDTKAPSSFRSLVLTLSLSFHSVFEGLAVGLQDTESKVLQLAVAILLHKTIIAASLALLLLQSRLPLRWLAASIITFALMSPLGVGLGMAVMQNPDAGGSPTMTRSVLEGVAAGTFMYITFLEILPQELNDPARRLLKVLAVLLGFSGMAGLRFLG
ncbi:zinc transporter ZIP1-like [Zootoca vivipara]|uniref:zinc transporter ZIP1-like n=1 Tax=Zootoca vivipara TaxID=8524 RepID=UPI0015916151|nr:zinc transporter ZIP1-like [Zootoca vivipara]